MLMNAIKSILLHVDASLRSATRQALAAQLAERLDAAVSACFAATPAVLMSGVALGEASGLFVTQLAEVDAENRRRAQAIFDAASSGPRVRWDDLSRDLPVPAFIRRALAHDLLVLGQFDRIDPGAAIVPPDFVESVVIGSGRPAIVVPYAGEFNTLGGTVLVAWKPTPEAARAVQAALPLLRSAQQVHVAGWGDDPREIERLLLLHGIDARYHHEPDAGAPVGELLLSRAADLSADLLVMGCYGHSRARELVLGGASRQVLQSMTVPVLLCH
jgi:nucleotide-binding universal stress UspA family protein